MKSGSKHKDTSKIKMSEAHRGNPLSDRHRASLIGCHDGFRHTEETKRKIGLAHSIPIDKELLSKLYLADKLTIKEVALHMNISAPTIHRNLKLLGIVRSPSEAKHLSKPPQSYPERRVPSHSRANKKGYVKEHILIWEEANDRPLPDGWVIHHLNGIKNDNRPENLVGMPSGNHCSGLVNTALRQRIRELEAIINGYANNHSLRKECGSLVGREKKSLRRGRNLFK